MKRLPALDGLRGIAILAVLAYHASYETIRGGWLGVDLFFVLSGFLITSLLLQEEARTGSICLRRFYAQRALRILPPLAVTLALVAALAPTVPVLPSALFFANLADFASLGPLKHTWSLSIEEQFYLAWPFLFLTRWRRLALGIFIVAALVLRLRGWPLGHTLARIDGIAIGALAAMLPAAPAWLARVAMGLVALMLIGLARTDPMVPVGLTVFALACSALMRSPLALLDHPVLRYLGLRSYGLYLYHWPIFFALEGWRVHGDLANFAAVTAAKLALTFAAAEVSYRTIEAVSTQLRHRMQAGVGGGITGHIRPEQSRAR